jgi:hypothetical protein
MVKTISSLSDEIHTYVIGRMNQGAFRDAIIEELNALYGSETLSDPLIDRTIKSALLARSR